jgi:hypothetical protein
MFYDIYLYTLCYYICCLLWRMYEMHPALSFKTGCYIWHIINMHVSYSLYSIDCNLADREYVLILEQGVA